MTGPTQEARNVRSVRGALGYSFLHRYAEIAIRLGFLVVLSRLVGPEGFGVFAVALAITTLMMSFCRDGPLSWIVRDQTEGAPRSLGEAAIIASVASAVCGIGLFVGAAPLAHLIGVPDAASLLRVLSLIFAVLPLEAIFAGLLRRDLAFGAIAIVGVVAVSLGGAVAVGFAAAGFDALALTLGAAAELSAIAIGSALAARAGWPLLGARPARLREAALFSARLSAGNALANLAPVTATLATARFLGVEATGLYDRARRVTWAFGDLVLNAVSPVVLPALSEAQRAGAPLRRAYLFKVQALSLIAWPFFAALSIAAEPVVRLALGPDWLATVPLVQTACLLGLPLPFHTTDTQFLVASGKERFYLRIQVATQIAMIAAMIAAAQISVVAVFAAFAGVKAFKAFLTTTVLSRAYAVSVVRLGLACAPSALVALGVAGAAALAQSFTNAETTAGAVGAVAVTGLSCAAALVGFTIAVRHPIRTEALAALRHAADFGRRRQPSSVSR